MSKRIVRIVKALLQKTELNGCSQEEALAAAEKVNELLTEHNLTLDEIDIQESPISQETSKHFTFAAQRIWKIAAAISKLTTTKYWKSRAGVFPVQITFFGLTHEVEIAHYLLAICDRALRTAEDAFNKEYALIRKELRRSKIIPFLDGMVDTLAKRIEGMIIPVATGNAPVVCRNSIIDTALAEANIKLDKTNERNSRLGFDHYSEGELAGNLVPLNKGLGGNKKKYSISD